MPLHDWTDDRGWDGVHHFWITDLTRWIQPRLPEGYRAYVGSVPALTIDNPNGRPDVMVRQWEPPPAVTPSPGSLEPDQEVFATFTLDPNLAVHIDLHGKLIAAVELVSPRNKDRPSSKARYLNRYLGYIRQGVHLLLIDLLPRPRDFSFADALAADLGADLLACPVPFAVSYRVGGTVPDGTLLGTWRRELRVGEPLPSIPLALNLQRAIVLDLETTYMQAASTAYID